MQCKKFRLKIPYYYREIEKKTKIYLSLLTSYDHVYCLLQFKIRLISYEFGQSRSYTDFYLELN